MNKDELKGKAENLMGRAKQAIGTLTGDKHKEGEGLLDRLRGAVSAKAAAVGEKAGKAADGTAEKADEAKDKISRDVSREEDEDE
jgi:uncharacterized protein YjbJ (UPF0337 family)